MRFSTSVSLLAAVVVGTTSVLANDFEESDSVFARDADMELEARQEAIENYVRELEYSEALEQVSRELADMIAARQDAAAAGASTAAGAMEESKPKKHRPHHRGGRGHHKRPHHHHRKQGVATGSVDASAPKAEIAPASAAPADAPVAARQVDQASSAAEEPKPMKHRPHHRGGRGHNKRPHHHRHRKQGVATGSVDAAAPKADVSPVSAAAAPAEAPVAARQVDQASPAGAPAEEAKPKKHRTHHRGGKRHGHHKHSHRHGHRKQGPTTTPVDASAAPSAEAAAAPAAGSAEPAPAVAAREAIVLDIRDFLELNEELEALL
jgi:hypothetical protein